MAFPYISQIKVNNCYTYQDFSIPHQPLTEFKHIVLTGQNGSGKSTILNRVALLLSKMEDGRTIEKWKHRIQGLIEANPTRKSNIIQWNQELLFLSDIELTHLGDFPKFMKERDRDYILAYFNAQRRIELRNVETITQEGEFVTPITSQLEPGIASNNFKQFLVNKKVYEAFDFMDSKEERISQSKAFFDRLTNVFRRIFQDDQLELVFVRESFEFFLKMRDGREMTFNQLSDGYAAFLNIVIDLMIRTDLIRKEKEDFSLDPEGIIVIDEPETHMHLSMQYEILPLINTLFPNIQMVIATHSPAVISSIKNAIIYDLTSKEEVSDWVLGSSYSELMIRHFGLDNEYSPIADNIILEVNNAVKEKDTGKLKSILSDNEQYLTPSLKLEIESQLLFIERA